MLLSPLLLIITTYVLALLAMAFYTLLERKMLGYFQLRKGPNKVSLMGLPQPLADALKLFTKELTTPSFANSIPFLLAPTSALLLALLLWSLYPSLTPSFFMPLGALFFLSLSSLNVYTTLSAGWTSNSKYALLGALRAVAQTISYEVSMSLLLISILLLAMSFDFSHLTSTTSLPFMTLLMPLMVMWFISTLAETNRTPFDFAEGESELVSGFNIEFGSGTFAFIFMAEYTNILMMSFLTATLFLASPVTPLSYELMFATKTLTLAALFIWIRATLPRMRYDRLMALTWKTFLPFSLAAMTLLSTLIPSIM